MEMEIRQQFEGCIRLVTCEGYYSVFVGRWHREGEFVRLEDAHRFCKSKDDHFQSYEIACIAKSGLPDDTPLDPLGTIWLSPSQIKMAFACEESVWERCLSGMRPLPAR